MISTTPIHVIDRSGLYFLCRFRSFIYAAGFYRCFIYSSEHLSLLWFARVAGIKAKDRLNKLIKTVEDVVVSKLPTLEEVRKDRMLEKTLVIMNNAAHPLHETMKMCFSFCNRLITWTALRNDTGDRSHLESQTLSCICLQYPSQYSQILTKYEKQLPLLVQEYHEDSILIHKNTTWKHIRTKISNQIKSVLLQM